MLMTWSYQATNIHNADLNHGLQKNGPHVTDNFSFVHYRYVEYVVVLLA